MKNVIIGTAGHVDHGKTCLIKALTGTDTDRLKEEKQRGITIELGFAELHNDNDMDIGIIDVPGHEKFVKHMLAGIGGIDIVLLIIAADEGIMPQTVEHFQILKMLKITKGIIVITKADLVDEEWLEMVREDISDYVDGTFLGSAPIIDVSARTGKNIECLKKTILSMAKDCGMRRDQKELLRLPVDRVFTVDGFGTVITGTLMEGSVVKGDDVRIYPSTQIAKVRNIQVHGCDVTCAMAGQRTAINLAGIKKENIKKGNVVAAPGTLETTMIIDVKLNVFDDVCRTIKTGSRLHFYYGAAEALCKVVLLADETLKKGQSGYAQLRFEEEITVKRGDRFILRFYSPMETIGGGIVLNAASRKRKRYDKNALLSLKIQETGTEVQAMEQILLEEGARLTKIREIVKKMGLTREEGEEYIEKLQKNGNVQLVSKELIVHNNVMKSMEVCVLDILDAFHRNNPVNIGMPKEEFRKKFGKMILCEDIKSIEELINLLLKKETIKDVSGFIALPNFMVEYTDAHKKLLELIEKVYNEAGFEPPTVESVMEYNRDSKLVMQLIDALYQSGKLQKLNYQYYMHVESFTRALDVLKDILIKKGQITLSEYRDILGTSRKYAMMILECTDEMKLTQKVGDNRILRK